MTVRITKPKFNLREKLTELDYDRVPFQKMPAGSIIQVQQSSFSTYATFNNTTFSAISGFSVDISPKFVSSKILITLNLLLEVRSASVIAIELTRGGSSIFTNEGGLRANETANGGYTTYSYLDSPKTIDTLTYGVQTRTSNSDYTFNNYIGGGPANSFLTVMEIAQ
tara:strand:- start:146 stop:646 length:501 start_codon:yes stop_codon:yes gene_type:complete